MPFRGWTSGDVRCLSQLPKSTFYNAPNWIECILLAIVTVCASWNAGSLVWLAWVCFGIIACEVFFTSSIAYPHTAHKHNHSIQVQVHRVAISLLASLPVLSQDVVRLCAKLSRGHLTHLCLQFDWMDGQREVDISIILNIRIHKCVSNSIFVLFF